jgi:hypothetical protein
MAHFAFRPAFLSILPAAEDLLPLLHDGLKQLYRDYEAESFLLRAKPDGAVPFGRNWGNDSVLMIVELVFSVVRGRGRGGATPYPSLFDSF